MYNKLCEIIWRTMREHDNITIEKKSDKKNDKKKKIKEKKN